MDSSILQYIRPAGVAHMQYADDLDAKFYKVAHIYAESPVKRHFCWTNRLPFVTVWEGIGLRSYRQM